MKKKQSTILIPITLIPVEGMPKCYQYLGTPEQLKIKLKFKILDAKVTIYE